MIADKAAIVVNTIFSNEVYKGMYVWVGGVLYSVQLYTDFLACVCIAQGSAALFGIHLVDNFAHPYFSKSIKDFWRRWHISLSQWLRDYVYIPLDGSKKGKIRKYVNLMITFLVSGIWHGRGYKYIVWGGMHAIYQIVGEITMKKKDTIYKVFHMNQGNMVRNLLQMLGTFFWVMLAWIIFRADSLRDGVRMIVTMFTTMNFHIFIDGSLLDLGLDGYEWSVLLLSILILFLISLLQRIICIRDKILRYVLPVRWTIYIVAILAIMVFGSYGIGFNAQEFIYGGF